MFFGLSTPTMCLYIVLYSGPGSLFTFFTCGLYTGAGYITKGKSFLNVFGHLRTIHRAGYRVEITVYNILDFSKTNNKHITQSLITLYHTFTIQDP